MRKVKLNPDPKYITQRISGLSGQAVKSVALVSCEALDDDFHSVSAFLSRTEKSPLFRHAIEMEQAYCDALLRFDEIEPPDYGRSVEIDLDRLAIELDVAQVFCVVTVSVDGTVNGWRNYDEVEVTVLEAIAQQLGQFHEWHEVGVVAARAAGGLH